MRQTFRKTLPVGQPDKFNVKKNAGREMKLKFDALCK
jgi:hypothetical protein